MSDSFAHRPKLIVYADQNADDRTLVAKALAKVCPGVELFGVSNGKELLDLLHGALEHKKGRIASLPDAVLLELNMPRKSGLEALAELKAIEAFRDIPVIIFSTSSSETDMRNAFRLGASSYVRKPRSFRQLIQTIVSISDLWTEAAVDGTHDFDKAS